MYLHHLHRDFRNRTIQSVVGDLYRESIIPPFRIDPEMVPETWGHTLDLLDATVLTVIHPKN